MRTGLPVQALTSQLYQGVMTEAYQHRVAGKGDCESQVYIAGVAVLSRRGSWQGGTSKN